MTRLQSLTYLLRLFAARGKILTIGRDCILIEGLTA